jgi:hypothetical protein
MADYYPVISRAIAALETNTLDARRDIYNHARAVHDKQLNNRPYNKKDFDHERLMLENAINRVEIEATGRRLATGPSPSAPVQPGNIAPDPTMPPPAVHEDNTREGDNANRPRENIIKRIRKIFAR